MPAYNKFNTFVGDLSNKVHNLGSDTLKIMLSNVAPSASNAVKADITEISAGNGYSVGGTALGSVTDTDSSGTVTLAAASVVFTASAGSMAAFRYAILYNSTPGSGPLIAWWDNGSVVTLNSGDSETISFPSNIFTLT
jgi:hypothetical protein